MLAITSYRDLEYYEHIRPEANPSSWPKENWYIILLGNLNNETPALRYILDNYLYLNRRTKDARYFVPGFYVDMNGLRPSLSSNHKENFQFDHEGFLDTVDWLENGSTSYEYSEDMEMILLPYRKESQNSKSTYDFANMLCFNLDELHRNGKNILNFILKAVKVTSLNMSYDETKKHMNITAATTRSNITYKNIFIAGSKKLREERDGIRAVFSQISNRGSIKYQTWTYEDFDRSLINGGRQDDYNHYIEDIADSVLFVLDNAIGGITKQEFDIAFESFKNYKRPSIHVYCKKYDEDICPEIQEIIDILNNHHQYFIDYKDIDDLKHQVFRDFA